MNFPHTFARVFNAPLMVAPAKLAAILGYLMPRFLGQHPEAASLALQAGPGPANREQAKPYHLTQGGAALIRVVGTLIQRGDSLMEAMSGVVSYDTVRRAFRAALADPEAKAILLEFDSAGGEVAGCFDLVDEIYQARGVKPIWAIANEAALSAAYALASAADRVFLPRTALVGSVGVLAVHVDQSGADKRQGYAYTAVYAGAQKNDFTPHAPLGDGPRARLQAQVDQVYALFVETVARNRGLGTAKVRGTEAGVYLGEWGVNPVGLADEVATMAEVLANIGKASPGGVVAAPAKIKPNAKGEEMEKNENREPQAQAEGSSAATPPQAAGQPAWVPVNDVGA